MFFLGFGISIVYSCFALSADSCVMNSLSIKHEQKTFADLLLKGRNMIFMNLVFNQSNSGEFLENKKLERWVWVANDYRYILSYPEDVDVFSFGQLKAEYDSLEVEINIGNLTDSCKHHFNSYLAQYLSKVVQKNATTTDISIDISKGYICHSKIGKDTRVEKMYLYLSDISAVKLGFPFWCYENNNTATVIKKSYVNYIVVFIIFFTYCFYPLAIESAFYIEDKKMVQGYYYMSESPYGPSVFCTRILFAGNNKYLATLRIILIVSVLTCVVYAIKSTLYNYCNCSLRSSNDNESFQHAENVLTNWGYIVLGVLHFIFINICVLVNSNGILDDFLILDFTNICNHGMFLKTVKVSEFLSNIDKEKNHDEEQSDQRKNLVSQKIQKIFLVLSYSFWSKLFLINSCSKNGRCLCVCARIQSMICFFVNIVLVLGSTFCPVVSTVYIFFVNHFNVVVGKTIDMFCRKIWNKSKKCEKNEKEQIPKNNREQETNRTENMNTGIDDEQVEKVTTEDINIKIDDEQVKPKNKTFKIKKEILNFFLQFCSHSFTIGVLTLNYKFSFNIFFCGMSYVIQYFIFTLLLAVPHFPIQYYIYIIFFTSVIIYISRFVFQFIKLYKNLLEKILEIQEQTSIPINHFDRIVAKHFPLPNELFYLLVKIMLSCLFFAIIYDTMHNVGYIRFGAQPDLTTVISLIFLFGPPRLVEALLMTDFTSRVHMKEKEIKDELLKIKAEKNNTGPKSVKTMLIPQTILTEEERVCLKTCIGCWRKVSSVETYTSEEDTSRYSSECLCCRKLGMLCCGTSNFAFDDKENCKCCVMLTTNSKSKKASEEKNSISEGKTSKQPTNNCCDYSYTPKCVCCRWLGMFFCGCFNFPFDDEGNCVCCVILTTNSKSKNKNNSSEERTKLYDMERSYWKIPCLCVKDCLIKDNDENPEEEMNLFTELKTDTLYKITVDTVDEIRARTIYKVKAEGLNEDRDTNDGIEEFENGSTSDKSGQDEISSSNENDSKQSDGIVSNVSKSGASTETKNESIEYERDDSEHDEGKDAGNARTLNAVDEKRRNKDISDGNETGNSKRALNNSSEKEACAKSEGNYSKITAIIEHDGNKPNLDKEENDDHPAFDGKESNYKDNGDRKRKDIKDSENKVIENIELENLKETENIDKPRAKET